MISKKTFEYFIYHIRNGHFWGSLRLDYDFQLELVTVPQSWWRKCFAALNFVAHLGYAIFQLCRYVQYCIISEETAEEIKVLIEFAVLAHLCPTLYFHSCFLLREAAVATFINQYVSYYQGFEGTRQPSCNALQFKVALCNCFPFVLFLRCGKGNRIAEKMRRICEMDDLDGPA